MKLIIREYLASLRERRELDALLPDLLSQMGLDVFAKPGIGNRQYGVDVAAFGSIDGEPKKVYLFSIKRGDLGRKDWNSGSIQDLQPSMDEIRDTYIPTHLPVEYKDKPIEICICFGGDLKEEVRLNVSTYEEKYRTEQLSFSEWGGEKIAGYIEKFLLREELLPKDCRRLLRKSLAMLDEPDVSHRHFCQLIKLLANNEDKKPKEILTAMRQLNLCLWILYTWCREADNLESSFLSGERAVLTAWHIGKPFLNKKKKGKISTALLETSAFILSLYTQIVHYYLENKILPHTGKLYAISRATAPSCALDVNLKLFDLLGRLALSGIWLYWLSSRLSQDDTQETEKVIQQGIEQYRLGITQLIANNPILFTPYKDDQAIDIALAAYFLAIDPKNHGDLHAWLSNMVNRIHFLFQTNSNYPCTLRNYHELLEHPIQDREDYQKNVTNASVLYPTIAVFAALFGFENIYSAVQKIKSDFLEHCDFQYWYPDATSEEHYYTNDNLHGAAFLGVYIDKDHKSFLEDLFSECEESAHFHELSAIKYGHWPLLLLASRHYRLPIPLHFLKGLQK
ncbi:MAG: hypothetical protein SD837_10900 [Candidatus Electrothrix scaldis]|nr:MAG: hypothetical protein SD837_10900 [Candidatus Electrothrix sp. GW3-3]